MNTDIAHTGGGRSWLVVPAVLGILTLAVALRMAWTEADPPIHTCSGVTHADESWMHAARNKALWGSYHLPNDEWRPELVSYPTQWLTGWIFSTLGVSTTSLRLAPQLLGALTAVLVGLIAWRVGGRRAGLAALLLSAVAFPLVAFSRVAMIEGFLVPVVALLLLAIQLKLEGKPVGILIGAAAVLCFAVKASAVLFLFPIFLGLLAVVLATGRSGQGVLGGLKSVGTLGVIVGGVAGAAIFYALVIHGNQAEWWFANFKAYSHRATFSPQQFAMKFILLPTYYSEAVLIALGPVAALAAIEGVGGLCSLKRRLFGGGAGEPLEMREQWRIFLSVTTILSIVLVLAADPSGRRVLHLAPMLILLASGLATPSREAGGWERLSKTWRAIVLLAGMPLVYVGARGLYSAITQTGKWLATGEIWSAPFLPDKRHLVGGGIEFGVFGLLFAVGLILAVRRPAKWSLARVVWPLIVLACVQQLAYAADYFGHRTYTVIAADRRLAELVPPGTPVLGNAANVVCWENRIRPIFSYPDIKYANRDEAALASWNAPYVLMNVHGQLPDESKIWDDYDEYNHVKSSNFWRAYDKVAAAFPIYDTYAWSFTREGAWGYYVLLKKP